MEELASMSMGPFSLGSLMEFLFDASTVSVKINFGLKGIHNTEYNFELLRATEGAHVEVLNCKCLCRNFRYNREKKKRSSISNK